MRMDTLRTWCTVLLVVFAIAARADDSPFRSREVTVSPSPASAVEIAFAAGQKVVDFDVWSTGAEAAILIHDVDGKYRLMDWKIGALKPEPLLELPVGFEGRAITCHPAARRLFVLGRASGQSVILAAESSGGAWRTRSVFKSSGELRRLMVAPRPFEIGYDENRKQTVEAYRLVFGKRMANGSYSVRSITESGEREYQIIGPESAYVSVPGADAQPAKIFADAALPEAFHPAGNTLLWQDNRGCHHELSYGNQEWDKQGPITGMACGGTLTLTPNGAGLLHWQRGEPGIAVLLDHRKTRTQQATQYSFASTPSSVPDGKGIVGLVESHEGSKLVYAPISVPMADVVNAWMFVEDAGDHDLFATNGGLFRKLGGEQLYSLYDSEFYDCGGYDRATPTRPYLVTTDILWEIVAAAYEGTFIVQERQQAIPAFWSFVDAARTNLSTKPAASPWRAAFEAIAALHANRTAASAEAARIARASSRAYSPVFGAEFNYSELKPRGHYASNPDMAAYFKAVHYLTQLAQKPGRDPRELSSLPEAVKTRAMRWIRAYEPYIAPSRGPLVWGSQSFTPPPYAHHPADHDMVFPLSWGFDNEALLSTVYHADWPTAEQVSSTKGYRLVPSGLDVAAAFGSGFARTLLKTDLSEYAALGPVLDSLAARRPATAPTNLYDRWLDALAVQWADEVSFPGASDNSSLWKTKRIQTGLASWATLRHATVLVNERTEAECGEGGFEAMVLRPPRGYVEPDPKTFAAIASLFDETAKTVSGSANFQLGKVPGDYGENEPLRQGVLHRLREAAEKARLFQHIAERELRGEELTSKEYEEILYVGRVAEHQFLVFKSLASQDLALSNPDPMMKIADVAGGGVGPILEAAVGRPLEWDQIVPFFGRREVVKGSVYSYYELTAPSPLTDVEWRARVDKEPRPAWITPLMSTKELSCPAKAPF
jgi:hypothetical protein